MTEMKRCTGCGALLQNTHEKRPGYVDDLSKPVCRRCYRIKHYGDFDSFKEGSVSTENVLEALRKIDGVILLVLDITDIESGLFTGIRRHLQNRQFIIALTKRDLLPKTVSEQKILQVLARRLKEEPVDLLGAVLLGNQGKTGIGNLKALLKTLPKGTPILTAGYANVGKSTLLNALIEETQPLTIAPYPHTTLEIHRLDWEGYPIYDTPGIRIEHSLLDLVPFDDYPDTVIRKPLRPLTYQLRDPQTFILPRIGMITLIPDGAASVTLYFSDKFKIHRTKADNRDAYIERHKPFGASVLKVLPVRPSAEKSDVVFRQVGWFCLQGNFSRIEVHTPMIDQITLRKAMI